MIESMIIAGCMLVALLYMTACSDKLDVQQMYEFDLATLPVQTTIVKGEEAEIRCQLVRSGEYELFSCVKPTLEECRRRCNEWLKKKRIRNNTGTSPLYRNGSR